MAQVERLARVLEALAGRNAEGAGFCRAAATALRAVPPGGVTQTTAMCRARTDAGVDVAGDIAALARGVSARLSRHLGVPVPAGGAPPASPLARAMASVAAGGCRSAAEVARAAGVALEGGPGMPGGQGPWHPLDGAEAVLAEVAGRHAWTGSCLVELAALARRRLPVFSASWLGPDMRDADPAGWAVVSDWGRPAPHPWTLAAFAHHAAEATLGRRLEEPCLHEAERSVEAWLRVRLHAEGGAATRRNDVPFGAGWVPVPAESREAEKSALAARLLQAPWCPPAGANTPPEKPASERGPTPGAPLVEIPLTREHGVLFHPRGKGDP